MPMHIFRTLRFATIVLAAVSAGVAGIFLLQPQGDASLKAAFASALEARAIGLTETTATRYRVPATADVAASEEEWLGSASGGVLKPVTWEPGVSIGDQITIATSQGSRVLKVVGISALSSGITRIDTAKRLDQSFVVTAREVGPVGGLEMRFIVDAQGPAAPVPTVLLDNRSL